jgi:hypothetical protein
MRNIRWLLLTGFCLLGGGWIYFRDHASTPVAIDQARVSRIAQSGSLSQVIESNAAISRVPADANPGKRKLLTSEALLESICPRLSEIEEKQYFEKYGRNAASLIGLLETGSPNGRKYLGEALSSFPDDPLVQYAALAWAHPDLNLKTCSGILGKFFPNDSLHRQVQVKELLLTGDLAGALAKLKVSAVSQTTTNFSKEIHSLANEVWQRTGRTPGQVSTRAALEGKPLPQGGLIRDLVSLFGTDKPLDQMPEEARSALPYIAYSFQDLVESTEIRLDDNILARVGEREALEKLLEIYGSNQPADLFPVPLEQMIAQATKEEIKMGGLAEFVWQLTDLYQRIEPDQQTEFVRITNESGQQKAMVWLFENNPNVFIDPDYPPSNIPKEAWQEARFLWLKRATGAGDP